MKNRIQENSTKVLPNAMLNDEIQNRLEKSKKEGRNHVADAQKQMSSQATVGVFDENQ